MAMKLVFSNSPVSEEVLDKVRGENQKSYEEAQAKLVISDENKCQSAVTVGLKHLHSLRKAERDFAKPFKKLENATNPKEFAQIVSENPVLTRVLGSIHLEANYEESDENEAD